MERLSNDRRPSGLSGNALRVWGIILLAAAIAGRSIIQNRMFGIGSATAEELLAIMDQYAYMAPIALILQVGEACAAGIFSFLLVEGVQHTSDIKRYFVRVLGVAVLSEIPYNIAIYGKLFYLPNRNPVLGLALCLIMLAFYRRYPGFTMTNVLYKVAATVGALLWGQVLAADQSICVIIISATLWAFRKKHQWRVYAGALAAVLCSAISFDYIFYMIAPVAFLLLHFYNGEKGETNPVVNYLSYPVLLIAIAAIGAFAF